MKSENKKMLYDILNIISSVLNVDESEITDVCEMKKGMTNKSFLFSYREDRYIIRIPGEGTDNLINRFQEKQVYDVVSKINICDAPIYINQENGIKITRFLHNARVCDCTNQEDVKKCMKKLNELHNANLIVEHEFDIFRQIEFYESLRKGIKSIYSDYEITKSNVYSLKPFVEKNIGKKVLCHIDSVFDNFLFYMENGDEKLQLTDWEYAGMQDPDVDIAMFCIYAFFDKKQTDDLLGIYYSNGCNDAIRYKVYAYMAMCGLLWSNWCEYKSMFGVEFGKYKHIQYNYAKEFYQYSVEGIKSLEM